MIKPVVLLASGTRGDVQPYLALALRLRAAGYAVRVAAPASFRELAEHRGSEYAPLQGNPSELLSAHGGHRLLRSGQSALTYDGNWLRSGWATWQYVRRARPLYRQMLESAWHTCQGARAIVVGLATTWGAHIAEALGVPCLYCFLQPFSRTRYYPSALLPWRFSLGAAYNRLSHLLVELATWLPWRAEINRWRQSLHLPPLPVSSPYTGLYRRQALVLYGYSPRVAPPPPDWPAWHQVVGYWFLDELPGWTPPPALLRFLQADPPPLYIGFGSPGTRQPEQMLHLLIQALQATGLRAVLSLPAGMLIEEPLPPQIFPITDAPHAWLFQQVMAVVHHGGAGITAAALRAGKPAVVLPLAVDQFFWGERLAALGVAPQPLPQRALTSQKLAAALNQVIGDPTMRQRAGELAQAIRGEDGVGRAVELILAHI